jgi:ABC-type sugar transport system substrate-binding protein
LKPARQWRSEIISDVLVSLAAGAILAGIAAIGARIPNLTFLTRPIPLWLGVFAGTSLIVAIFLILSGFSARESRRVFVLIPAFGRKYFWAEYVWRLLQSLEHEGYDAVVKMPDMDFSPQGQVQQLRNLIKTRRSYAGGFIITARPDRLRSDLRRFCQRMDMPVVFVDVRPFDSAADYPPNTVFVGYDAALIGLAAAQYAIGHVRRLGITAPLVLVIGSESQMGRQREFERVIRKEIRDATVTVNDQGAFVRERAHEIVDMQLTLFSRDDIWPDVVFCTNDEMALGALDAIRARAQSREQLERMLLLGVDGTIEAIEAIRIGRLPFRATVVQDVRQLAEMSVDLLVRKVSGEEIDREVVLAPTMHPPKLE